MIEFKLPSLGADMDEGTLLTWHVKPGDTLKRGQVVAVVDTSKAAVDVDIWHEGVLHELLVHPGEKVPVGTVLARLLEPGEVAATAVDAPAIAAHASRRAVSPSARRRAKELGVNVESVKGSGAQGAVTLADIEAAAHATTATPDRQTEMRKAIAAAMSRSKREIPHYYLAETIPMANALDWLQQHNKDRPITERLLPAVLLLKAVALALQRTPELNGFFREGQFMPSAAVHTGVAISLRGGGLVAPALHDVDNKPLPLLMQELADLVKRARAGSLRSSEMSDPTLTVTNLGDQGVESVFGVIYPPQVALVGFGSLTTRPWVVDGKVRAQPLLCASLAADHRASDGHRGALFLAELRDVLQRPESLDATATQASVQ
ncbi:MAG: dihydrolipoamide acetyltransferase family protein [Rhodoferax sp.]|uniref:dihydrolipoamide acetyltransferase family protein n=1 Tax=Rhodoferax sp. TaxID=50421 RepID=UPI003016176C